MLLFMWGCSHYDLMKSFSEFKANVEKERLEAIERQSTKHGMERLTYSFGDLSRPSNRQKLSEALKKVLPRPHIRQDGDSVVYVIYVVSAKSGGTDNTLSFVKKGKRWLLDDYRQGK